MPTPVDLTACTAALEAAADLGVASVGGPPLEMGGGSDRVKDSAGLKRSSVYANSRDKLILRGEITGVGGLE